MIFVLLLDGRFLRDEDASFGYVFGISTLPEAPLCSRLGLVVGKTARTAYSSGLPVNYAADSLDTPLFPS